MSSLQSQEEYLSRRSEAKSSDKRSRTPTEKWVAYLCKYNKSKLITFEFSNKPGLILREYFQKPTTDLIN